MTGAPAGAAEAALTEAVAAYVAGGRFAALPDHAVRVATLAVRDCLGVLLAGLGEPSGGIVASVVRDGTTGGAATVLGRGFTAPVAEAAFVNATTAHALDFDDSHHPSMTHPTAVLLPALLAVGERVGCGGADLLTAYLYALDASAAIAGAVNPEHYSAGWHPTATVGALAAALGAARLLSLPPEQTAQALRIAANRASGQRGVFGSMGKAMNAGTAAQTGVVAALLAARGFHAGAGTLAEFARTHGAGGLRLSHPLDGTFTTAIGGLSIKRFPSCGVTQAPIEAALRLHGEPADTIDEVTCVVDPYIRALVIAHPPGSGSEARFNLEHCVAVALVDGEVGMAQFTEARVRDPAVRRLAGRVRVEDRRAPAGSGPDLRWPCEVRVAYSSGATAVAAVDAPAGRSFGELLPESELRAKFTDCAGWAGLSRSEVAALAVAVDDLASLPSLDPIIAPVRRRLARVDTEL